MNENQIKEDEPNLQNQEKKEIKKTQEEMKEEIKRVFENYKKMIEKNKPKDLPVLDAVTKEYIEMTSELEFNNKEYK